MNLTDDLIEKLCSYVRMGVSIAISAQAEGIPVDIVQDWLIKSESGQEPYSTFAKRIMQAKAQGEILHIQRIVAQGSAKESQWLLERMYPERWATKKTKDKPTTKSVTGKIIDSDMSNWCDNLIESIAGDDSC